MLNQLKKWLRGDADLKAEQQIYQQAKADTFLRDAMEGYQSMPEADHAAAVSKLKEQLKNRTKKESSKRAVGFDWRSIAAAAAFVGAIAIFYWTQREIPRPSPIVEATAPRETNPENKTSNNTIDNKAKAKVIEPTLDNKETELNNTTIESPEVEASVPEPSIAMEDRSKRVVKPQVDPSNIEAGIIEEEDLNEPEDYAIDVVKDEAVYELNEVVVDDDIAVADEVSAAPVPPAPQIAKAKKTEAVVVEDQVDYENTEKIAVAEDKNIKEEPRVEASYSIEQGAVVSVNSLNGSVVDLNNNEALIGVNVLIKGTNDGVVTDVDGGFSLNSDQPLPWNVIVSYIGYVDQEIIVNDVNKDLNIILDVSGVELSEVVVTSSSARSKSQTNASTASGQSYSKPKPVVSSKKMKRYLRKNLNYPSSAKDQKIEGAVTIRFYINANGVPEQLSVISSLESACDQEAIRLLKEGPKWKPKNTWTTYTIEFKL